MAEYLSAGVFVEEVASQVQVIQGVSTSNLGIVGYTDCGPENDPQLVTSFDQFTRKFGPIVAESFLPLSVAAFFSNGGRRCYVVRVVPEDAVAADADIRSKTYFQAIETGDGALAVFTKTALTTPLKVNDGASPVVPSTVSLKWRELNAPIAASPLRNRANTAAVVGIALQLNYEARINPSALPAIDEKLFSVVPDIGAGVTTLNFTVAAAPVAVDFDTRSADGRYLSVVDAAGTFYLDCMTGFLTLSFAVAPDVGTAITLDFTVASDTKTAVDDGLGVLTGDVAASTITYATGAYSIDTTGNVPHDKSPILCSYQIAAWDLNPISKGTWANSMQVIVRGNEDYYTLLTGQYSRFDVLVLRYNTSTLVYEVVESYEALDFATPTSSQYFVDVINELSDLITVTDPGADEAPGQLSGVPYTRIVGAGDSLVGSKVFATTLGNAPVQPRSFVLTYTDTTSVVRTITDDGAGSLTGSIDPTVAHALTYSSGAFQVTTLYNVKVGTFVSVSYVKAPEETSHLEQFGDTTKGYTAGTNGTFDSTNYGRSQFSDTVAQTNGEGIWALDTVEELMQLVVPDFAGDATITGDIIDYCETRAALPPGADRFAIFAAPIGSDPQETVDWFKFTLGRTTKHAALYGPWINIANPLADGRSLTMPPMAHIAGIYARTDVTKNVGKSPAGTVDGQLNFLIGLEQSWTQAERDLVYANKINPLISGAQTGFAVWGSRTISNQSEWRNVVARRTFNFVERSTWLATHWVCFENNGPKLWTRITSQLQGFLMNLFNEGYFAGTTPSEAFFVKCDGTNNDQASIDAGKVITDIGIACNKPAEFVIFRFTQHSLG